MDSTFKILRVIFKMLAPWKKSILTANLLSLIASLLAVVSILAAYPFFEIIFNPGSELSNLTNQVEVNNVVENGSTVESESEHWLAGFRSSIEDNYGNLKQEFKHYVQSDPVTSLYLIIVIILCVTAVRIIILGIVNYIISRIETKFIKKLTYDLYVHVIYHDRQFFSQVTLGKLLTRFSVDMFKLRKLIELVYTSSIQYPVQILILIIMLFIINYQLAIFSVALFPLILVPGILLSKRVKKLSSREIGFDAGLMELIEEQFSGQELIKAMKSEDTERARFEHMAEEIFSRKQKRNFLTAMSQPVQDLFSTIAIAIFLVAGIYLVFDDQIISGSIFLYILLILGYLYANVKQIIDTNVTIQKPLMSARAILKILDRPRKVIHNGPVNEFPKDWEKLVIQDLWFRYGNPKHHWILSDINLTIEKNSTVLLRGLNGSGKSTLAALLAGFYKPVQGDILLRDTSIYEIDFDDYRNHVGYISQNAIIFNLTVAQNIAFGVPENKIDYERLSLIVDKMGMKNFIENLPGGLKASCGFKGDILSGGQRQLLAFCRALYFDHDILILDEPTSNLDETTKERVFSNISNFSRDKTVIIISHSSELPFIADKTIELNNGIIEELKIQ